MATIAELLERTFGQVFADLSMREQGAGDGVFYLVFRKTQEVQRWIVCVYFRGSPVASA
jgi:hypothetical protein